MLALNHEVDARAKAAAAELGPGPDSVKLSDADKVARWNFTLPIQAAEALVQWADQVMQTGQQLPPPEVGHPAPLRVLDWMSKGGGREAAAEALYPLRYDLYARGRPNIEDQVREAGRLSRLAARHSTQEGAGS